MARKNEQGALCGFDAPPLDSALICGIDEAGRGPLAGPVYAASVVLPNDFPFEVLNDSKKLSEKKRLAALAVIKEKALCFGLGSASHTEIDKINILQASLLAMKRSFVDMAANYPDITKIKRVIVDGQYAPNLTGVFDYAFEVCPMVRADAAVHAVMAASIIAKTARDAEMARLAALYPAYRYDKHKGYPTAEHRALVAKLGPSPVQRLSFKWDAPVSEVFRHS